MAHLHLEDVLITERQFEQVPARGAYRWDARVKLALLVLAVVLNIWLAIPWLSGAVLLIGILLLLWSRPPFRRLRLFLLAPLWASCIALLGFALGFGTTPLATWGHLVLYREGLQQGGLVAVRAYCDMVWLALTFVTTPFPRVLATLRWYRLPEIVIDTLAMMYRYSFLLYDEFLRMRLAAQSRGGRSTARREAQVVGRIAAQIFMRAYDRSERIYWAMFARGGE